VQSVATSVSQGSQFTAEYLYALSWADRLFESLAPAALHMRPIKLRHPCIFYYGHLPAFTWNQIFRFGLGRPAFNAYFDVLFERGIDPADDQHPESKITNWPAVEHIADYKQKVQTELFGLLSTEQGEIERNPKLRHALNMVLEHYWMHVETFIYMMHQLPLELKRPVLSAATAAESSLVAAGESPLSKGKSPCTADRVYVPAGTATLGADRDRQEFGWDNEFGSMRVPVEGFAVDRYPVTNGGFLEFIENGGYDHEALWTPDGWAWIKSFERQHPQFWVKDDGKWLELGLFDVQQLDEHRPAWVSFVEAQAYAKWKNARLMTEAEFHRAAFGADDGSESAYPWGDAEPQYSHGNFGLRSLAAEPVGSHPGGASRFGVEELLGNGWEWTQTAFAPLPGFTPLPTYPGYSADFFDARHYVLKGASPITSSRLLRRSFRNWFQPHYPYMYAKFRCVYGV
jgi:ergothioneine biosynthesis protein EgtB